MIWQRLMVLAGAITLGVLLGFVAMGAAVDPCVWPPEPIAYCLGT